MATPVTPMRPLCCWKSVYRELLRPKSTRRTLSSLRTARKPLTRLPSDLPKCFWPQLPARLRPDSVKQKLKVYPPPPSAAKTYKDPVAEVTTAQLAVLDPTGERKKLFSRKRPADAAKVGDILLVTFKTGDPYSGVCLNIRQRGVDTSILLRNQLTRVGVEMWVKIFSPNVQGIEVVQRREKRARRARLYYMRQPKHDMGSVQNIVYQYVKQKQALGASRDRKTASTAHSNQRKAKR